jgi:hypothetical protein
LLCMLLSHQALGSSSILREDMMHGTFTCQFCCLQLPDTLKYHIHDANKYNSKEVRTVNGITTKFTKLKKLNPWPEFARELYRPSGHRLSAKLVPTFADRGCRVVSVTDPYGRILGFLDRKYRVHNELKIPLILGGGGGGLWAVGCVFFFSKPSTLFQITVIICLLMLLIFSFSYYKNKIWPFSNFL